MEDLITLIGGDWNDHFTKLELILTILKESGLKCNIEKSVFGKPKCNIYLFG